MTAVVPDIDAVFDDWPSHGGTSSSGCRVSLMKQIVVVLASPPAPSRRMSQQDLCKPSAGSSESASLDRPRDRAARPAKARSGHFVTSGWLAGSAHRVVRPPIPGRWASAGRCSHRKLVPDCHPPRTTKEKDAFKLPAWAMSTQTRESAAWKELRWLRRTGSSGVRFSRL